MGRRRKPQPRHERDHRAGGDGPAFPQWPDDAEPCVWMSAGLLAYRLCDRAFDCEHCPLDAALRGRAGVAGRRALPAERVAAAGFPGDRRYGPAHSWVRRLDRTRVRCGLDAFAARLLAQVTGAILPLPRSRLRRGQVACWLRIDGMVVPLRSPVDGTVHGVNLTLQRQPSRIVTEPYDGGWLFDACHEADLETETGLVEAETQRRRARSGMAELDAAVAQRLAGQAVGTTLPDGGEPVRDLLGLLGPRRFRRLLARFLDTDGLADRGCG